eukprot:TRINITY_DN14252_c0_g1_i6.p1 TRINITY_DN14252_c0_g1~~TRINITY_DN14252_c0_g1_i6.p1  ORF type:complete len:224 (-),score=27.73 TRINITY_DN14252_c0_g1_i6:92-733(-)
MNCYLSVLLISLINFLVGIECRGILPSMLPNKQRFLRNLENLSLWTKAPESDLQSYDTVLNDIKSRDVPRKNWTQLMNETSKLRQIIAGKIANSNKVFKILLNENEEKGSATDNKIVLVKENETKELDEETLTTMNSSLDEDYIENQGGHAREDQDDFLPEEYFHLETHHIQYPEQESDKRITNALLSMIEQEILERKLERLRKANSKFANDV